MEIVQLLKDGGPFALAAVLGYLYLLERKERQELQVLHNALLERALTAIASFGEMIKELKNVITAGIK